MTATPIRAAVLDRPGASTRIETLDLDPPGAGEVRVRMVAAGVCHSDLHVRDGEWERPGPIVLGHEGAAVVESLGPEVADRHPGLRPGVLVALAWMTPCGRCRACRAGRVWL
ncbi:MAG TPA: alcohol dehydrogenase catalytic domain-containing protein, partial [Candidatus Limnocylindrales bacterium]|nr:alcohol dehydrogenase catalytic domain-containing protein [Candidatus Limnocylindrales bacterium]